MAIFNKFNDFAEQVGLAVINLNTDVLKIYLSNQAPQVTDTIYDVQVGTTGPAEFAGGTGYTPGGINVLGAWSEDPAGTGKLTGVDPSWTAGASDWAEFRYAVLYSATGSNRLIGWWDKTSGVTLADGESFTVQFSATVLTIK